MDRAGALGDLAELLLRSMHEAAPSGRAALAAQYRATLAELEAMDKTGRPGDPVDELSARRAARGGATARARRPAEQV